MLSPVLFVIWIPVIVVAALLLTAALLGGAAVGIDAAFRGRWVVPPRVQRPTPPALPRKAAEARLSPRPIAPQVVRLLGPPPVIPER
jgi:hypothetical protein